MWPALNDGDYIVLRPYTRRRPPRCGDIVAYRAVGGQQLVKRLTAPVSDERWRVAGDGVLSAPSVDLGPVPTEALAGRVVWTIRTSERAGARRAV